MKKYIFTIVAGLMYVIAQGQIGYQVSLLNTATGEPRANESVQVSVSITDSQGATIYNGTQSAVTNDFGILSLTVGDASTFDNVDWAKLPLYISATVDGILIGRSQILNVPVAEYAKRTGSLTKEILCSKTWNQQKGSRTYNYNMDGTGSYTDDSGVYPFDYVIEGNIMFGQSREGPFVAFYNPSKNTLFFDCPY